MEALTWEPVANGLFIFALRLCDVSLRTITSIMIMRGLRKGAALVGFAEVTIWVVAISQVIGHLDSIWNIIGYSGGFSVGTLLGMWIESKMGLGFANVHVISTEKGREIAAAVREHGFGATQIEAEGRSGPVYLIDVVVTRKRASRVLDIVESIDDGAFVTVQDARHVLRGYHTPAFRLGR